jgi:hypothetical protein
MLIGSAALVDTWFLPFMLFTDSGIQFFVTVFDHRTSFRNSADDDQSRIENISSHFLL